MNAKTPRPPREERQGEGWYTLRDGGTYLKITGLTLALLISFNVILLKDGIRRIIPEFLTFPHGGLGVLAFILRLEFEGHHTDHMAFPSFG